MAERIFRLAVILAELGLDDFDIEILVNAAIKMAVQAANVAAPLPADRRGERH